MKTNYKLSCGLKLLIFIIGTLSITAATGILDNNLNLRVFTMFTTLTNLLCTIYFLIEFIYQLKVKRVKTLARKFKNTLVFAITLTMIVAHFVLKMSFSFDTFMNMSFLGVHYIIPILIIIDWIIFEEKGKITKGEPFIYLLITTIYFIAALIAAAVGNGLGCDDTSRYPYPFLDIDVLGVGKVIINCIIIKIGCLFIGYSLYFIDKFLKKDKRKNKKRN